MPWVFHTLPRQVWRGEIHGLSIRSPAAKIRLSLPTDIAEDPIFSVRPEAEDEGTTPDRPKLAQYSSLVGFVREETTKSPTFPHKLR